MGLDIYLYRYDHHDETIALQEKCTKETDAVWEGAGDYDDLTEEQKDELREKVKAIEESYGLDRWGEDEKHKEKIEFEHPDYPEHYFKVGYFRSSYNGSGINRILENMGLPRLEWIFDVENDDYYIHPDWNKSLQRAEEMIEKLSAEPPYRVIKVDSNIFKEPDVNSESDALKILKEQLGKEHDYNYSNSEGEFYLSEPLEVVAMIPGFDSLWGKKRPCVYAAYKTQHGNDWYIEALKIVKFTIEYVLAQPADKIDQYYLHWSG